MTKKVAWVVALAAIGCAPIEGTTLASDTGTADTLVDSVIPDAGTEVLPPTEAGAGELGAPCVGDECDPLGDGDRFCTSRDPVPFCATNRGCDVTSGPCVGGKGFCMSELGSPTCRPRCTFAAGGAAMGCPAGDACVPIDDAQGYCFGGCVGTCKVGLCQRETGLCAGKLVDFARAVGAPCTAADGDVCVCTVGASKSGYCTSACLTGGGSGCPSGTVCDLPGFSVVPVPTGLAGRCLHACVGDGDCAGLSSTCKRGACHPS